MTHDRNQTHQQGDHDDHDRNEGRQSRAGTDGQQGEYNENRRYRSNAGQGADSGRGSSGSGSADDRGDQRGDLRSDARDDHSRVNQGMTRASKPYGNEFEDFGVSRHGAGGTHGGQSYQTDQNRGDNRGDRDTFQSFRNDERSGYGSAGSGPAGYGSSAVYGRGVAASDRDIRRNAPRQDDDRSVRSGNRDDRGMLERAGDEVASWFGDEDAARRRENDHRGKGPRDYKRSDTRVEEDINDRLSDDTSVDASDISVSVNEGEATLSGTVTSKHAKRCAEDCADAVSGVKHVQNNLRVASPGTPGDKSTSGTGAIVTSPPTEPGSSRT